MSESVRKTAVDEVADGVRGRILGGAFVAGADLPAERDLCEELGVSRLTLRAAITRLEGEGLLRPRHGAGTRVLDYRETGGLELVGYLARYSLEGGRVPVALLADLLEVRRSLAVEVVGLVAERASASELVMLRAHVAQQATLVSEPARLMAADLGFARKLVRATHNLALELLFNTIVRQIEGQPGIESAFMAEPRRTLATYGRVLDFVEARDARGARKMTRRLLDRLDERVLEVVGELAEHTDRQRREERKREKVSEPFDDVALERPEGRATALGSVDEDGARVDDERGGDHEEEER
jgi:GntR family transcriptional regulator, transcriptional repressor for pyruvate dehydrogenase complex